MHEDVVPVTPFSGDDDSDPTVVVPVSSDAASSTSVSSDQYDLWVAGVVRVCHKVPDRVVLHWSSSPGADVVADSLVAVIAHADVSAACMKLRASCCGGKHGHHAHGSHDEGVSEEISAEAERKREAREKLLSDLNRVLGPK
jgi:Pre-mRNA 3'-end-processing endonuclease polyadenylation factor C-term